MDLVQIKYICFLGRSQLSDPNLINKICSSLLYKSCDSLPLDGRKKGILATFLSTLFFSPFVPKIPIIWIEGIRLLQQPFSLLFSDSPFPSLHTYLSFEKTFVIYVLCLQLKSLLRVSNRFQIMVVLFLLSIYVSFLLLMSRS